MVGASTDPRDISYDRGFLIAKGSAGVQAVRVGRSERAQDHPYPETQAE